MSRPDPTLDRARDLFARASERLDQGMVFRLRRAREAALRPVPARHGRLLWPAGAVAASVMALGLAWWLPARLDPGSPVAGTLASDEVEALVMAEDAELYAWLAEAPVASRGEPQ
ncbi:hypothetical protein [Arenimonas donghaensis]|uniref:DUF3619 family protein n=1 Tax=Arenimonas donghaensis DSM 18148 = HO3-R19 TaxID=1121014 RepID=A0A087MIQ8_9GAMM|nr:hypothetical protein [Arenimonas donghaensis]KFL36761.1 hypothetical protein N788_03885 [Arenimonas donghaensis DSM 18148 = HO3-R19]